MGKKRIPESNAILGAPLVPPVTTAEDEILERPFTLHEAARLVATEAEWDEYMIIGREPVPFAMMPPFDGTRYQMRRGLEARFWGRIQKHVVAAEWRAIEIGPSFERALGQFQITGHPDPFAAEELSARRPVMELTGLIFAAVDRTVTPVERDRRESEAMEYIKAWAQGRPRRIKVDIIEEEIGREFARYNFSERGITRIRKRAGLGQVRGVLAIPE